MFTALAAQVLVWMVKLEPLSSAGHTPEEFATWPALAEEIADSAELAPIANARWTAAVMTVYGWHESRFRWSPCSKRWTCDHGQSAGVWQTATSWGSPGAALTLLLMHESWERCGDLPAEQRLAAYAWGPDCDHRRTQSRLRVAEAERLMTVTSLTEK